MSNLSNLSEKEHEAQNLGVNVYCHTKLEKTTGIFWRNIRLLQVTFPVVSSIILRVEDAIDKLQHYVWLTFSLKKR
jgi:hypothetical protein